MWHISRRGEVHTKFWWGNQRECDHLEDLCIDGRIKLKPIFKKWDGGTWTTLIWFRLGTDCGHL
jgi:hypothetical protein